MAFCDFVVKHEEGVDSPEQLTRRILYSIIISRIKHKKPVVIFVGGDSGEGKSLSVLRLQEILMEIQGLEFRKFLEAMNVFTPLEYAEKLGKLLYDKEFKKANTVCIHEAREVVKAKNWQSFLVQAVADVNAMSRSIKRMCIFIVSQFIRDISNDIRYTLNYYMIVRRPKGKRARLYINVMWKDDRDLEKPKLRKRKLSGYLVDKRGKYHRFVPQYLELKKPSKDIIDAFEKADYKAKAEIIRRKLNRLVDEMKAEIGEESGQISAMVDYYVSHPDSLGLIGKRRKGKWRLNVNARDMHNLSVDDARLFEGRLNEALKEKGMLSEELVV